jgi:NIPSNAP
MLKLLSLIAVLGLTSTLSYAESDGLDTTVYELRTYTTTPGSLPKLLTRFRDHTLALFEKHGIINVAYWVPQDADKGAANTLVYLVKHKSRDAAAASWKAFAMDPEWMKVRDASEAQGKIVDHIESLFLAKTDYSAEFPIGQQNPARIFELRTYTTPEGLLTNLDARFRGGETDLFVKEGMTKIFFTHPTDLNQGSSHILIYMLAHKDRDAAKASWAKFRSDPAWLKMKADSEVGHGPLTTKTVPLFLVPTDFSPTK